MTACRHMKVAAWPAKDEITQAVKDLWTGDPRQYTEITVNRPGESGDFLI